MTFCHRSFAEVAAAESKAARSAWGEGEDRREGGKKNIAAQIEPFLGSGLSKKEVARRLDCAPSAVRYALKKIGGSL